MRKFKSIEYILIPMAGIGKRYKKENFKTIKPLILVDHETIFEKSIKFLPKCKKKIVILKKDIFLKNFVISKIFQKKKINYFLLDKNTKGQSDTIFKIKNKIEQNKNVLIHSCDYILKYSSKKFNQIAKNSDVVVFVYKLKSRIVKNYESFAYCKVLHKKNKIIKINEKKVISSKPWEDYMAIGTFWFKNMKLFAKSHELAEKKNKKIDGEYYIANNINNLIALNYKVSFFEVDEWINLGDFFDFNQYIYWKNFFHKKKELILC